MFQKGHMAGAEQAGRKVMESDGGKRELRAPQRREQTPGLFQVHWKAIGGICE